MTTTAWILTREFNEYDQFGEYFVAWWPEKPVSSQLVAVGIEPDRAGHVLNGGGRQGIEDNWYHLRVVPFGKVL